MGWPISQRAEDMAKEEQRREDLLVAEAKRGEKSKTAKRDKRNK